MRRALTVAQALEGLKASSGELMAHVRRRRYLR